MKDSREGILAALEFVSLKPSALDGKCLLGVHQKPGKLVQFAARAAQLLPSTTHARSYRLANDASCWGVCGVGLCELAEFAAEA